ncbi:primase-helicase family protein [Roseicella aquatilis]|uniref:NrS-1 polymerase-like helicase domain-containing protein n=1 Tax=Roseicella aquatilis TaxID=2527868 RepID=A0A4R4D6S0_9PROT|nr:primase-helicase family protein [Roseicella aquatilis]TCZ53947.1 hypothetical protein EXY23_23945 [Roseicella aquatilis]
MNAYTKPVVSASEGVPGAMVSQPGIDTQEFFDTILPAQGLRCIAVPHSEGGFKHQWCQDNAEAATVAGLLDRKGGNVFYALAGFTDTALDKERNERGKLVHGGRKQANVGWLKAFWADLDCGEGKPYPSARDALVSLKNFLDLTGLAKPWIVSSGRGLHVYWPLEAEVERADWKPVAEALKQAFSIGGLHADPSRTSDEASVLRPVGCHHRKAEAIPVRLLKSGEVWSYEMFRDQVQAFMDANPGAVVPTTKKAGGLNAELWGGVEYPPTYADKVANRCAVMGLVRDTQGNTDQPTWYRALGIIAFCEDADQVAQDWSRGHPDYDPDEVAEKLEQVRQFKPTTCAKLAECQPGLCGACPHNGKLVSPIKLGMAVPELNTNLVAAQTAAGVQHRRLADMPANMSEQEAIQWMWHIFYAHSFGGSPGYGRIDPDGTIHRLTSREIADGYNNRHVRVPGANKEPKFKQLGTYYTHSPHRREVDLVCYDPEGDRADPSLRTLNTWRGFSRQERRGGWSKMRRHLFVVICRRNCEYFRFLICWLAFAVQRPGTAPGSVVILQSEREGTGKSIVSGWMCSMFGDHGLRLETPEQIVGSFNGQLENVSFLAVDEVTFAGDNDAARKLKAIITEPTIMIHRKYQTPYAAPNMLHIMITTNEARAVQAGNGARRFFVLDVDDCRAGDHAYFDALQHEAYHGGIDAMFGFLRRLDLNKLKFKPWVVPRTQALIEQQERSASVEVEWALALADSPQHHLFAQFGKAAATDELYADYATFAKSRGRYFMAPGVFGRWLGRLGLQSVQVGTSRRKGWLLPDADTFAAMVRRGAGILPSTPGG